MLSRNYFREKNFSSEILEKFFENFFPISFSMAINEKIFRENFFENIFTKIFSSCFVNFYRKFFFANTFRNVFRHKLTPIQNNIRFWGRKLDDPKNGPKKHLIFCFLKPPNRVQLR
jgi:hypothetical protein